MRLFLIPIAHRHTLLYAQRINRQLKTEVTYVEKIASKANAKWVEWEAAESGWQKKVTDLGNRAFARIPYQEWGLKSVPPLSTRRKAGELQGKEGISVRFPPRIIKPDAVLGLLKQLATERQVLHRKAMWWSVLGLPVTLPFGLIPIIPNLPFFYLAFRAWSHWRALNGSKHIQFLVDNDLVKISPSDLLQKAYDISTLTEEQMKALKDIKSSGINDPARERAVMDILSQRSRTSTNPPLRSGLPDQLFLPKGSGKLISRSIGVPGLDVEVERALAQVDRVMAKEQPSKETNDATENVEETRKEK